MLMNIEEVQSLIKALEENVSVEGALVQLGWFDDPYETLTLCGNQQGLILLAMKICEAALTTPQSEWKMLELEELLHENSYFSGIEVGVDEKGYIEDEPTPLHITILNYTLGVMFVIAICLYLAGKTKAYWWPLFN